MNNAEKKFWKEAFLVALPVVADARTGDWTTSKGQSIISRTARANLAAEFADDALDNARERGAV